MGEVYGVFFIKPWHQGGSLAHHSALVLGTTTE